MIKFPEGVCLDHGNVVSDQYFFLNTDWLECVECGVRIAHECICELTHKCDDEQAQWNAMRRMALAIDRARVVA